MAERICLLTGNETRCMDSCYRCGCGGEVALNNCYVTIYTIQRVCDNVKDDCTTTEGAEVAEEIRNELEKAADVQPVRHGEWEMFYQRGKSKLKCTNCHSLFDIRTNDKHICIYPKFCEECGADMRNGIQDSQELIYKKVCGVDVEASIEAQKSWEQWCDNVKAIQESDLLEQDGDDNA